MAGVVRRVRPRGNRAPQRITGINWASPFARGLVAAWPLTDPTARDYVGGSMSTPVGSAALSAFSHGPAWYCDGNGDYIRLGVTITAQQVGDMSILYYPTSLPDVAGEGIFTDRESTSTNWWGTVWLSGGATRAMRKDAVVADSFDQGQALAANPARPHVVGATYRATSFEVHINGALSGSPTTHSTAAAHTGDNELIVGSYFTHGTRGAQGYFQNAVLWNRPRSAEEVAAYALHPWDIYRTETRIYFIPAAAGGGTTTDVPLTTFSVSPQAPTTLRSLISNVPTL